MTNKKEPIDLRIYADRGDKPQLLGTLIEVNGKKAVGYFRTGKLLAYVYCEDLVQRFMNDVPIQSFEISESN